MKCFEDLNDPSYIPMPIPEITYYGPRRPWLCPVCVGKGFVSIGFYMEIPGTGGNIVPEKCRSCLGTGIVWG